MRNSIKQYIRSARAISRIRCRCAAMIWVCVHSRILSRAHYEIMDSCSWGILSAAKSAIMSFWLQLNSFKTTLIRGFRSFFHLLFSQPSTKSRRFAPFVCRARALLLLLLFGLSCLVFYFFFVSLGCLSDKRMS